MFWRNILRRSSGSYSFLRLHGVVIQKTTVRIFTMKFSNVMRIAKCPTAKVRGIVEVIIRHRKKSEISSVVLCCNMNIKTKKPTCVYSNGVLILRLRFNTAPELVGFCGVCESKTIAA